MASATFAEATATQTRKGTRVVWDRDSIITAIQEWVARYGEPPRAADWNPSSAKWSAQDWRIARYRAGREDGSAWPALNSAKRPFDGSLNAAIRAAGFEPAKPGPRRRGRVDLTRTHDADLGADGRALVDAARAEARQAERRIAQLSAQLDRARARLDDVRAERDEARRAASRPVVKTKVVRERVVDDAAVARAVSRAKVLEDKARAAVADSRALVAEARMDAAEARGTTKRLAARQERSEATVHALREERRELTDALHRAEDRATAMERALAEARAVAAARVAQPSAERVVVHVEAPEAETVRAALAEAADARLQADRARIREAAAERELRATVAAVKGEPRRLTPAELEDLRATGPAGPAVMAKALSDLATARRTNNPTALREALSSVARAAVTWQERL
jgi:hypothetical protein